MGIKFKKPTNGENLEKIKINHPRNGDWHMLLLVSPSGKAHPCSSHAMGDRELSPVQGDAFSSTFIFILSRKDPS
jgi:hypothetical protein